MSIYRDSRDKAVGIPGPTGDHHVSGHPLCNKGVREVVWSWWYRDKMESSRVVNRKRKSMGMIKGRGFVFLVGRDPGSNVQSTAVKRRSSDRQSVALGCLARGIQRFSAATLNQHSI